MTRYLVGFMCVLALGVTGCSETAGTGGSGGDGGEGGGGGNGVACVDNVCPCSEAGIRAAIAEGGGPFTFDCDYPDRIVTEAEIVIDKDVILDGEGDPLQPVPLLTLTVDGNSDHRVFSISEGVTAELLGLTVARGAVIGLGQTGGGIYNAGALTLTDSMVSDNSSATEGGGIACPFGGVAALTLTNSLVSGNTASANGGGIHCGSVTLTDSVVSLNTGHSGGGISGGFVLTNSSVSRNHGQSGGGLHGSGTLTDSTVSGNTATFSGGGIVASGPTTVLKNTTVSLNVAAGGEGGGILAFFPGSKSSTKQIPFEPVLVLTNSTVSGNTAATRGGGISIDGSDSRGILVHSTVSANNAADGSGIASGIGLRGAFLEVVNGLVDGQCHGDGDIVSNGYNIESDGDTCGFDQLTDQVNVSADDLKLGPLQDNGGPTMTHALGAGSVAIDQIPAVDCVDADGAPLTTDQRGVTRPQGDACDVGAVEMEVTP